MLVTLDVDWETFALEAIGQSVPSPLDTTTVSVRSNALSALEAVLRRQKSNMS